MTIYRRQLLPLLALLLFFQNADAFSTARIPLTTSQRRTSQLQAISIPFIADSSSATATATATWYQDFGPAVVDRHLQYNHVYDDDYIWDSGTVDAGYGFARIEKYETYLAFSDCLLYTSDAADE